MQAQKRKTYLILGLNHSKLKPLMCVRGSIRCRSLFLTTLRILRVLLYKKFRNVDLNLGLLVEKHEHDHCALSPHPIPLPLMPLMPPMLLILIDGSNGIVPVQRVCFTDHNHSFLVKGFLVDNFQSLMTVDFVLNHNKLI